MNENAETQGDTSTEPRLQALYRKEMVPQLSDRLGVSNRQAVPELQKIVLNTGLGLAKDDDSLLTEAVEVFKTVAGQKPVLTRAKKSVAGFKLRAGLPIGCKVTLRRRRMYEFLDRLINVVLPRIRDFRGLSPKSFDGTGNYSLGLDEYLVFPEIDPDRFNNVFGMDVTICTTAKDDSEARALLDMFGVPFRK